MAVAEQRIRGLEAQEELFDKEFIRDTRSLPRKIMDFVAGKSGATAILLSIAGLPLFLPETTYMVPFIALPVYLVRKRKTKNITLPFRMPITSNTTDYSDPVPGRKKFGKAEGIFFLGNEYKSAEELWLKGKDILTHMLVFGTTGSGKTEALVSLAFNAVAMGSGFFYIDPKAAPKLAMQVYKMARVCGRDDDFLVLSYSTAGKERVRTPKRLSNTTNPFAFGSPEGLTNLIVSLIPTSEGDNAIFSQNAQTLITGLMYALCELRDRGDLELSIVTLREHMTLAKYVELAERDDLSETSTAALQSFLTSVGWQEGKPLDKQPRSLPEQFGYARSYFGLTLASLENSYGHIYKTPSGEVDMYDVIKNRRILVTLLPSLEKAPAELSNLGKISLSGVRLACAVGLGDKIEGSAEDVLEALPTDSKTPFLSITDEYAAIPTPGYAEVLTQGRGLGIAAIVASQDFAGVKGADETGAQQMVENTKVKWAMKMESATDTWELFRELAAESSVMQTGGYHIDPQQQTLGLAYKDQASASLQKVSRIDLRDLQQQVEGEFHAFFNGNIVRGRAFFANPELPGHTQLRINRFLDVEKPDVQELRSRYGSVKELCDTLEGIIKTKKLPAIESVTSKRVARAIVPFQKSYKMIRCDIAVASFFNWKNLAEEACQTLESERQKVRQAVQEHSETSADTTSGNELSGSAEDFGPPVPPDTSAKAPKTPPAEGKAKTEERVVRKEKKDPAQWRSRLSSHTASYQVADEEMERDAARAEEYMGATREKARRLASRTRTKINESLKYPEKPVPSGVSDDVLSAKARNLVRSAGMHAKAKKRE